MLRDSKIYHTVKRLSEMSHDDAWMFAFDHSEFKQQIINSIRTRLFDKGTNDKDVVIGIYKPSTQRIDPQKIAGTPYTLKDTGRFYDSIYMGVFSEYFFIDGDAEKGKDNLFKKFGTGIIGLNEEQKEWIKKRLEEYYIEYVNSLLHGN